MKRNIILALAILMIPASFCYAHAPTGVDISYSHENEVLSIAFVHLSKNRKNHYIRKIEIVSTAGDIEKTYYARQEVLKDIKKDIPIKLAADENITIKIFCSKGGVAEQFFTVPEIE